MNLLRSNGKETFLDEIFSYLFSNFRHQYENVRIILPTGFLCSALQRKFLSIKNALILPNIITLGEIMAEGHEIMKMPQSTIGSFSPLEEKIILGEIISKYPKFNFNLAASIKFAPELAKLFYEIELNHIKLEKLKSISGAEEAKHWQDIYRFIEYAYNEWQQHILTSGKISRAHFQQKMLNAEISRLQNSNNSHLIIAGIVPSNQTEQAFFNDVIKLDSGHVILPYFPLDKLNEAIQSDIKIKSEHPLFTLIQFCNYLIENKTISSSTDIRPIKLQDNNISDLPTHPHEGKFDHLLSFQKLNQNNQIKQSIHNISGGNIIDYIQFDTIYDEAEYIGIRCKEILNTNPNASIAIINSSINCKNIYRKSLAKYVGQIRDLIGDSILENNAICLITDWADLCCNSRANNEFNLNQFFKLISNPEIACKQSVSLKKLLLTSNRFASNLEDIQNTIDNAGNKIVSPQEIDEVKSWLDKYSSLFISITDNNFTKILEKIICNIEQIAPHIWDKYEKYQLANSIRELYQTKWNTKFINPEDFSELLRSCLQGGRIFTQNHDCQIVMGRLGDTSLAQFDYSFIIDASEGNLPPSLRENPWLNKQAQQELQIFLNSNIYASAIYNFYLNLNAPNICITRSSKQLESKDTIESSLLLQIKLCSDIIKEYKCTKSLPNLQFDKNKYYQEYAFSNQFPKQISATDIETLIRAPYNFYAKKILKLKALNTLEDYPSFAEFGNFFHAVAENYTNQYDQIKSKTTSAKIEIFNHIADNLLSANSIPAYSKKTWETKIQALASEFVDFEDQRQLQCRKVYTETKGELNLSIAGKAVKIIAIADRIEIDKSGQAIILDYKTGTPPTKSELLSGQSPQLIIEALIMQNGGFGNKPRGVYSVIFVKIASSKPYIRLVEIKINKGELSDHMEGLKSLLEHYVSSGKYPIEKCDLKYDDYHHLARR